MKTIAHIITLTITIFVWGCSNNKINDDWDINETFVDTILNQISKQNNTTKRSEIIFLDSAIKDKKLKLKEQLKVFAYKSGLYCYYLQKPDSALLYADSMIFFTEKNPEDLPNSFTYTYYTIGDALYADNRFNEAYTYYFKARQLNTTIKDFCAAKEYSYRIGMILYNQGKFKDAIANFKQSFSEAKHCEKNNEYSNYYRKQELLNNIALCYYKQGNSDSALAYYQNALDFISAHQKADTSTYFYDEMAKGVVYGNIGDIYKKSGDLIEAEKKYKKSIAINLNSGRETYDAQLSYLKLAELYADIKEFKKLEIALAEIRSSLNDSPNPKGEIKWNRISWKYYEQLQKPLKAYEHFVKFIALQEQEEKLNKQIHEVDINKQLELQDKQNQLHLAQHENEVARTYLVAIIVILLLIILLSIILGRNWLNSRKHIATLKELNETVKTQNEQLEIAMSALQKTISEKDSILKLVAHDLRTPVASIPTMVEIIIAEQDETQKLEYLEMIKSACNSSLTLIAEIMATADISNKNIEKEPTLLNEFINDCAAILELKVKEKNQQLIVRLPDADISVMMNPEKMKRVVFNLVTNSVKFSKQNTTITLSAKTVNNKVFIEVSDNGIGIPEKLLPEIFNISKSGKRKGTDGEKSYGLGLNICKRIVEAHDGSINVQSQEGKGSTFTVVLPLS